MHYNKPIFTLTASLSTIIGDTGLLHQVAGRNLLAHPPWHLLPHQPWLGAPFYGIIELARTKPKIQTCNKKSQHYGLKEMLY